MISPSEDMADILAQSQYGLGLTPGTNLFIDNEPDGEGISNDIVSIFNTSGSPPDVEADIYNPTVMVRIRGAQDKYSTTYALALDILEALHGQHNVEINNSRYLIILAISDVQSLGKDEKERDLFSINFRMMRTPTS